MCRSNTEGYGRRYFPVATIVLAVARNLYGGFPEEDDGAVYVQT